MAIRERLMQHHVHWFVAAIILLYAVSVLLKVPPVSADSVAHADVGAQRVGRIDEQLAASSTR